MKNFGFSLTFGDSSGICFWQKAEGREKREKEERWDWWTNSGRTRVMHNKNTIKKGMKELNSGQQIIDAFANSGRK